MSTFEEILKKAQELQDELKKDFGGPSFKRIENKEDGKTAVYGKGDRVKTLAEQTKYENKVNPQKLKRPDTLPKEVEHHLLTNGKNLKFGSPDHMAVLKFVNETATTHPEYSHHVNGALLNKTCSIMEKLEAIEELIKSNYGPKGAGLYDPAANQARKKKNIDTIEDIGQNKNVKQYTSAIHGTADDQAEKEAKEAKAKSKKNPVKVGTPEEVAAMNAKLAANVKKSLPPGYIQLQPTDEELFGGLIKTQEEIDADQNAWNDKVNSLQKAMNATVEKPEEKTAQAWKNGTSFNDLLSEEEKRQRNMCVEE